uniref:Retrovirus-related Pol polyprotein from transposon TNT 1-94 n=1 Tax=Cajanus cajan TaxID=3821 RepID=A0A151SMB2_CAJCA|nr:Retrovirus-related Pol polyprotein from transposon TNT 1-94 [Cajanus cajan]
MDEEFGAIERNKTWELTNLPEGARPIGVKWVYKKKMNVEGEVERYKARLVVKGYRQKKGIDYDEVFSPVTRMESIRLLISLAAQKQWPILQMDVKSAFLNGVLKEEVYVEQPLGYMKRGDEKKVLRLRKSLYGLKQAPRSWNERIDGYFKKNGYEQCPYEHALYIKKSEKDMMVVALYVDDLIFTGSNAKLIKEFKEIMKKEFEMTDLGLMKYFLGLEVKQSDEGIFISQERYALEILKKFKMEDCNPVSTPMEPGTKLSKFDGGERANSGRFRSLVGSLRYLTSTRPDLMLSVGITSKFMEDPSYTHWKALKRILRYVRGSLSLGLFYSKSDDYQLVGYSDSDWCGDVDDRKSTSGYVFLLENTAFTWLSKKQPIVTLSTCEAEYVAASWSVCHAVWLSNLLRHMGVIRDEGIVIRVDNKSAIELAKNLVNHGRSKHIDVRFHFIREQIREGKVELEHVESRAQAADIFTKPPPTTLLENCKRLIGMRDGKSI